MNIRTIIFAFIGIIPISVYAGNEARKPITRGHVTIKPIALGNFANPSWPSTVFGFGQNILGKNTALVYASYYQQIGDHYNQAILYPECIYGITDHFSLDVYLPVICNLTINNNKTSGVGDLVTQFEHVLYQSTSLEATNLITILANASFPTGDLSLTDKPSTGLGAMTFFAGFTASRLTEQWYAYLSSGATLATAGHGIKSGNNVLYNASIGHNLGNPFDVTILGLLEMNGTYLKKTKNCGEIDENTGGNTILLGPSLYCTRKHGIFLAGIQFPVFQKLHGTQNKQKYLIAVVGAIHF